MSAFDFTSDIFLSKRYVFAADFRLYLCNHAKSHVGKLGEAAGRPTLVDYERKKARDGSGQQRIELEKPVKLCRDPEKFAPFSHPELLQDIKKMHNPDLWALASLAVEVGG